MSILATHESRTVSAEDAVATVRSGDRVYIHPGCAEPELLVEALGRRARILRDVEIMHLLTMGRADYVSAEMEGHFRHNSLFTGANVRAAVWEGRADFTPVLLHEVPHLFTSGRLPIDVALIHVSPPDEHGYLSLGVGVECTRAAADVARTVIAQVNPRMPRTLGDSFIHASKIDLFVEHDAPILEARRPSPDPVSYQIADHVAGLIEDGATLQLGIGAIPDAVLSRLSGKRDIGIHTEMFSDGLLSVVESGVVTNDRKSLHRGKVIASFMLGSRELYDFVDNNPMFEFHPTEYVNDPFVISRNERMTAINSALSHRPDRSGVR